MNSIDIPQPSWAHTDRAQPRSLGTALRAALRHPLALLLLAFCCNTLLWAAVVAPTRNPDELAHIEYVRHLLAHRTLPVFGATPYVANPAAPNPQAMQPPLYYLLVLPLAALARSQALWESLLLRAGSVLLGALTVALAYRLGRALAPGQPLFALTLGVVVGFNPAFTAISAAVNNDNLVNLIYAALLLWWWRGIAAGQAGRRWLLGLGALLGAGLLAKFSITAGIAASGALLLWMARKRRTGRLHWLARAAGVVGGAALALSGWLLLRNWLLYGDPTTLWIFERVPSIYAAQPYARVGPLWEMLIDTRGIPFWRGLGYGFWGIFDAYTIWQPERVYLLLSALLALGCLGALVWARRAWARRRDPHQQQRLVFAGCCALLVALVIWSNISRSYQIDYQPQGRYLLPALIPLALVLVGGLCRLCPQRWRGPALALLVALMVAVNLAALSSALIPVYHDAYLRRLAAAPAAPRQPMSGAWGAEAVFVARQPRIEGLELLATVPAQAEGPLVVRLRSEPDGAELASVIEDDLSPGLARYRIDTRALMFAPGQRYRVVVQAPWTTPDKALTAHLAPETGDDAGPLGLRVAAPSGFGGWLREQAERLRIGGPSTPAGALELPLLGLMALLALAVVGRALALAGVRGWRALAAVLLGGMVLGLSAPPAVVPPELAIAERMLLAAPGAPLRRADAPGRVAADLLLLSGDASARKQPSDDRVAQTSLIQPYRFAIGQDSRAVLAMQPASAITYTLRIPPGARLETALALNPQVWQSDKGDGVEFLVRVRAGDATRVLLRRWIDPKQHPADRRWHAVAVDLAAFAGRTVELSLEVGPGPRGDASYDWAAWAEPLLVHHGQ